MAITHEDFQKAKRISRAIQEYIEKTQSNDLRSTDVYPYLARKGLVEKDRHNGLRFRQFLNKLKDNNLLTLIPQCVCIPGLENEHNEWHFYSSKPEIHAPGLPLHAEQSPTRLITPSMTEEEVSYYVSEHKHLIEALPRRKDKAFTPQEKDTRQNYPRAYEFWTDKEIEIIRDFFKLSRNIDSVARLLDRQPSAVQKKIEERQL